MVENMMRSWLLDPYLWSYLESSTDYTLLFDRAPAYTASSLRTLLEPVHPMLFPEGYPPLLQTLDVGV